MRTREEINKVRTRLTAEGPLAEQSMRLTALQLEVLLDIREYMERQTAYLMQIGVDVREILNPHSSIFRERRDQ